MVLWYNGIMKKEFIKESGKFALDLAKIMFAITFLTPLAKGQEFSTPLAIVTITIAIVGLYLTYKGSKDDE